MPNVFKYLLTSSCLAFTSGFHPSLLKDWADTENGVVGCCFAATGAVTIPWPWFSVTMHKMKNICNIFNVNTTTLLIKILASTYNYPCQVVLDLFYKLVC